MRLAVRIIVSGLLVLTALLLALKSQIEHKWGQYGVAEYVHARISTSLRGVELLYRPPRPGIEDDRTIVMARRVKDNTDWVAQELSDWHAAIYTVDADKQVVTENLTTPLNKGHEAMAYLTYIIDYYAVLPSVMVFLHAHRSGFFSAWHIDTPLHSNVDALQMLRLDLVRARGYINLRCNHDPGCLPAHTHNAHVSKQVYADIFRGTSSQLAHPGEVPERIGAACCAQFAVSREQVRQRPAEDYVAFRQWIMQTSLDDASSGRVMEFLWHIFFGRDAVHCPPEEQCYCDVYGRC